MTELTRCVLDYQRTGIGLEKAYAKAACLVYEYPRKHYGFRADDCGEFLIFFHANLLRLIDRYRDSGRSFEAYLYGTLKWQIRTFGRNRRRSATRYELANHRDVWEEVHPRYYAAREETPEEVLFVQESVPAVASSPLFELDSHGRLADPTMRRRVTILALKACISVDDDLVVAIAAITGNEVEWLHERLHQARTCMHRRNERLETLQEQRVKAYFGLRLVHDAALTTPTQTRSAGAARAIATCHRRLRNLEREIAGVPRVPTNGEVAQILGIPKGTVDSSLFYLKRTLTDLPVEMR
jgi:hypothetical protein